MKMKMKMRFLKLALAASVLPLAVSACGDDAPSLLCGEGTTEVDGECVADSLVSCGEGTYEVAGECTPFDPNDDVAPTTTLVPDTTVFREAEVDVRLLTEPGAHIFYTTDGSDPSSSSSNEPENVLLTGLALGPVTLKFFAIDGVGNQEATQTMTLEQDLEPPAAVTDLILTEEDDESVTLTWTNPTDADFAGVVVMREGKQVPLTSGSAAPEADVVYIGAEATATDIPGEGYFNYRVVSFDEVLNYGGFATVRYEKDPELVGTTGWSVMSNGTVTEGTTPAGVDISITHDAGATFIVSATNNGSTVTYQAPKVMFTNVVDGAWGDGTIDTDSFVRLGENGVSFPPGATLTGSFTVNFTGIADGEGVFTATTDMSFRKDPIWVVGDERSRQPLAFVDHGTFTEIGLMDSDSHVPSGSSNNNGMQGVVGRDGSRFIWSGNRSHGSVRKIDTATWTTVAVAEIGGNENLVGHPLFGPAGLLWVPLSTAGPAYIGTSSGSSTDSGDLFLVGIAPDSMTEVRRIFLGNASGTRLREIQRIPGTQTFVIANHTGGRLFVVDVSEADAAAVQTIVDEDITASRSVALSADGETVYLAAQDSSYHDGNVGNMSEIDLLTGAVTLSADVLSHVVESSLVDASGLIWFGSSGNISILDPSDDTVVNTGLAARAMVMANGSVYIADGSTLEEVAPADQTVLRTATMTNRISGHGLDLVE